MSASYSCFIAVNHCGLSNACFNDFGSQWASNKAGLILGKWIPDFDLVCIGWELTGLAGGDTVGTFSDATLCEVAEWDRSDDWGKFTCIQM